MPNEKPSPSGKRNEKVNDSVERRIKIEILGTLMSGMATVGILLSALTVGLLTYLLVREGRFHPISTPTPTETPMPDSLAYLLIKTETLPNGSHINTLDLSINAASVGQLLLTLPTNMNLGDSDIVRLSITPDSAIAKLSSVSIPTQNSDLLPPPFQFSDRLDIYPVMQAELNGAGFEIAPEGQIQKVILSETPTEWVWTIKPKDEGTQLISLRISIPVKVDDTEGLLDATIKNIPTVIRVTKPLQRRIGDLSPAIIPALIAFTGAVLGLIANNRKKEREREIAELERRFLQEASEKERLAKEIARIKAIPSWQFWRK